MSQSFLKLESTYRKIIGLLLNGRPTSQSFLKLESTYRSGEYQGQVYLYSSQSFLKLESTYRHVSVDENGPLKVVAILPETGIDIPPLIAFMVICSLPGRNPS